MATASVTSTSLAVLEAINQTMRSVSVSLQEGNITNDCIVQVDQALTNLSRIQHQLELDKYTNLESSLKDFKIALDNSPSLSLVSTSVHVHDNATTDDTDRDITITHTLSQRSSSGKFIKILWPILSVIH